LFLSTSGDYPVDVVSWGEGDKLPARIRKIRQGIVAAGQESAEPNFRRDKK
jgi:cyclohexadieny/prephenate dehydrogenase